MWVLIVGGGCGGIIDYCGLGRKDRTVLERRRRTRQALRARFSDFPVLSVDISRKIRKLRVKENGDA
jgi:hypothetical protein